MNKYFEEDNKYFVPSTMPHLSREEKKDIKNLISDFSKDVEDSRYIVRRATAKIIGHVGKQDK